MGAALAQPIMGAIMGVLISTAVPGRAAALDPDEAGGRAPLALVYPRGADDDDARDTLPLALLRLALEETGTACTVSPTDEPVEQGRAIAMLETGDGVNILWAGLSARWEQRLMPVRIPLTRGLLGLRVLLIRADRQGDFDRAHGLADLAPLVGGQAVGWPDTDVLRAAGLTITTSRYDPLFSQLLAGRIDYFPRAVTEARAELQMRGAQADGLTIERHLLLAYPSDMVFYTRLQDAWLAALLERGLRQAYADGRFMAVFNASAEVRAARELLARGRRLRLDIPNPDLSPQDRAIPARYWSSEAAVP